MPKWLTRPQRDDEYETFAARVLHFTLLLLMGVALLFTFFATSPAQLVFIPIIVGILAGCYYLLHRGRFRLASLLFVSGLWLVITLASFSLNGIRNASVSSYAIVIIFSAVLFSDRTVVVFTVISIVSSIILVVGETLGILPLRTTPLFLADRFFQQIALFGAAGILLSAASGVIRTGFQRIRDHEQLLVQRNRELETQIAERQRTEAKYRLLFENISVMAAVYSRDGEIILLNHAAAQMLGGTPETLQGRNIRDVLAADDAEGAIRTQAQVMDEGKDNLAEGNTTLPNGREIYYLRHIMPLPDTGQSGASQVLVLTTDLTEKYRAEQRERELALAREKNTFLGDFFSTLSHDLKTPLTVMNTSLYLLEHAQTETQRENRISRIREQVTLMDSYIQDMLTISRLEHLPTLHFQSLDLIALVEQVADVLRPRIEGKQILYHVSSQPDLPPIWGDHEQLRRMLMNLIENAINYTPGAGRVTVNIFTDDEGVVLEVTDSGIGIEPDALPHIFERFFRASNASAFVRSGTGLGLAIVKKIAEAHSATIDVTSHPGTGTTFTVQFPLRLPS